MTIADPERTGRGVEDARAAFHDLARSLRQVRGRDARLGAGMTFAQVTIVRHLANGPREGMSPGALATEATLSPAAVTEVIDALERAGLAERLRDEVDRRRVRVRLTAEGRRRYRRRFAEIEAVWERHLAELSPDEIAVGAAFLRRIAALLDDI